MHSSWYVVRQNIRLYVGLLYYVVSFYVIVLYMVHSTPKYHTLRSSALQVFSLHQCAFRGTLYVKILRSTQFCYTSFCSTSLFSTWYSVRQNIALYVNALYVVRCTSKYDTLRSYALRRFALRQRALRNALYVKISHST